MDLRKIDEALRVDGFRKKMYYYSRDICSRGNSPSKEVDSQVEKANRAATDAYENYRYVAPEAWVELTPEEVEKKRYDIELRMRLALYAAASLSMSQEKYFNKKTKTKQVRATYAEIGKMVEEASVGIEDFEGDDFPYLVKKLIAQHHRKNKNNILTPYLEKE